MTALLSDDSLNLLFRSARTPNGWLDRPVDETMVRDVYDLMKWGPTSANGSPARFVWVRSADGKATLAGLAAQGNKPKILAAPGTGVCGHDLDFARELPKLMPHAAEMMKKYFAPPEIAEATAMRNGTLQGAYLIVAARALGLDCGPMSGFDNAGVDKHADQVELHLQLRTRRSGFRLPAQPPPALRGSRSLGVGAGT